MPVPPEVSGTMSHEAGPAGTRAGEPGGPPARALVVSAPGGVSLEPRDRPVPGPGEVLIRPAAVGLCGTDLDILAGRIDPAYVRYPLVLGHEWSGTVLAGGSGPLAPGTRVVAEGIVPCGHCGPCRAGQTNLCETYDEMGFTRDGAAAGYAVVGETLVHPLAGPVSMADGALVEPASVVYRGLSSISVKPGRRALVVGDGTVALLAVALLGLWSPAEIVMLGRRPAQAALAATAGAARFETDPGAAGGGYDLVVEAAGTTGAVLTALAAARRGGTVLLLGLPPHGATAALPVDDLVNNDLTIRASFGYTSDAWRDVVRLLNAGRLGLGFLVTHRFPLAEWEAALGTLRDPDPAAPRGKVLLTLDG
ncbi:MAG: L-iditol 2-dehydrogenase [Streptosporangiaceae bacterium]|nr:L-iditol 2-dehydrogenase [Streptosporangiaceae bacterium]